MRFQHFLSAAKSVFICPEEPLEEEDLQISTHDDDKALEDRPGVHIVGLGLKQEVISPSAHPCYIIEAPHMLDSKLYLICHILGKESQSKSIYIGDMYKIGVKCLILSVRS